MGFLDKLFAKRVHRAKTVFANDVIGALRLLGEDRTIQLNEKDFTLDFIDTSPPKRVFLHNAFVKMSFDAYCALPDNERMAVAVRFAKCEKMCLDEATQHGQERAALGDPELKAKAALANRTSSLVEELRRNYQTEQASGAGEPPKAG